MTNGEQKLTWKCRCPIKILLSSENFSQKRGEGWCSTSTVLLCLHPPGDMSQGTQKTNHENKCVCMCTYMSAKTEKHLSTHFVPMGQKGNNMAPAGRMWGFADSVAMGVQFCGGPGEG